MFVPFDCLHPIPSPPTLGLPSIEPFIGIPLVLLKYLQCCGAYLQSGLLLD